jgi:cytochrome c oxidase assembly protein Cox11
VECFCFTTQAFGPRETRDLKLVFMVSPELSAHVDTLSLAYTYFTAPE